MSSVGSTLINQNANSDLYQTKHLCPELPVRKCSLKYVFLKVSQNLHERNCVGVCFK